METRGRCADNTAYNSISHIFEFFMLEEAVIGKIFISGLLLSLKQLEKDNCTVLREGRSSEQAARRKYMSQAQWGGGRYFTRKRRVMCEK